MRQRFEIVPAIRTEKLSVRHGNGSRFQHTTISDGFNLYDTLVKQRLPLVFLTRDEASRERERLDAQLLNETLECVPQTSSAAYKAE